MNYTMDTEKTFTTFEPLSHGTIRLTHNYPAKPSWKTYGKGRAIVEMTSNPKWPSKQIDMRCAEVPEFQHGTKEVYVSVPIQAITALLTKLGYTVTAPAPVEARK